MTVIMTVIRSFGNAEDATMIVHSSFSATVKACRMGGRVGWGHVGGGVGVGWGLRVGGLQGSPRCKITRLLDSRGPGKMKH